MKRTPSLSEQVRRNLRERITNDEFEDGRIPPEADLASELGVSRTTVRDALGRLESEGAIFRKQGAGTFVNEAGLQIKTRLDEIWSYEEALRAHGYVPSVRLLMVRSEPATPECASLLGLEPGDPVLVTEKLFLEGGEPVVLTRNAIPLDMVGAYSDEDCRRPIYEFLEEHCRRYLRYYLSDVIPVNASGEVARHLGLTEGTALLSFNEVGYDRDNEPVVHSTSFFRDDLMRFRLIRRGVPD